MFIAPPWNELVDAALEEDEAGAEEALDEVIIAEELDMVEGFWVE